MKVISQFFTVFLIAFVATPSWADEISDNTLNELMELSGINRQVAEIPKAMTSAFGQTPSIPGIDQAKAKITVAFNAKDILNEVARQIKISVSENDANEMLAWFKSDVGRKITAAEIEASSADALMQMTAEMHTLGTNQELMKIAERVEAHFNSTKMIMDMQVNTGVALFSAFSSLKGTEENPDIATMEKQIRAEQEKQRPAIRQFALLSFAYTYRNIPASDMEQYIEFLTSTKAGDISRMMMQGIEMGMKTGFERLALELSTLFDGLNTGGAKNNCQKKASAI